MRRCSRSCRSTAASCSTRRSAAASRRDRDAAVPVLGARAVARCSPPRPSNRATRTLRRDADRRRSGAARSCRSSCSRVTPRSPSRSRLIAACFIPAVTMWAASLVASSKNLLQIATALGGAPAARQAKPLDAPGTGSAGAVLGAIPGFASSVAIVVLFLASPWLLDQRAHARRDARLPMHRARISVFRSSAAAREDRLRAWARSCATSPRSIASASRRSRSIRRPRSSAPVAKLLGAAALPYPKDARLMRRRYPMAFALGALVVHRARDRRPRRVPPIPAVARRDARRRAALRDRARAPTLPQPPIELAAAVATLPIASAARRRAKLAWLVTWLVVFVAVPAAFALVRASVNTCSERTPLSTARRSPARDRTGTRPRCGGPDRR